MVILKNIKYKLKSDGHEGKLHAVKAYKEITGETLVNSKKYVEDAILYGEIRILDYYLGRKIGSEVFDCEIVCIDENEYNHIDEPNQETKEALDWYENQLPFMQKRIDLIIAWKQYEMIPRG